MQKNNCFIQINRFQSFLLYRHLFFLIVFFSLGFSFSAFGQIGIRWSVLNNNSEFNEALLNEPVHIEGGDYLFVCTPESLWFVNKDGREATKIEGINGIIQDCKAIGERLFVGSSEGLWIIDKNGRQVNKIIDIKDNVLNDNSISIQAVGKNLFFGSFEGLWIVSSDGKQVDKVAGITGNVEDIQVIGERLFVRTSKDTWIVSNDGKQISKVTGDYGNASEVKAIGEQVFINNDENLWIVDSKSGKSNKVECMEGSVFEIENVGETLFVIAYKGKNASESTNDLSVISKDGRCVGKVESVKGQIYDMVALGERLFVTSSEGLWIVGKDGGQSDKVDNVKGEENLQLETDGERIFVGSTEGLWIVSKDGKSTKVESVESGGSFNYIQTVADYIYICLFGKNPYRIDTKVTIKTTLISSGWWATIIDSILPSNWLPTGKLQAKAAYSDENGKDPYDDTIQKEFRFAKADGDTEPSDNKFAPADQFNYEIGLGNNNVHYWVKDIWGNTFEQKAAYRGVPGQYSLAALPFILSLVFVLGCFALAPKVGFCHSAIMNPWLRKYFSLGSVPLLLSVFPSLRRHILHRYSDSVNKDKEFTQWKERFVCPAEEFYPENFGKKLESERRLLLTGQSGIGKTSYFKHLTADYVSQDKLTHPPKVFPVYIPLTNYGGNSLEDLVYNQLFAYGKITDKELAPMFLEQGGLLIFLDGVNEVQNISDRQKLSEFVEKYWTSNFICLSSQQVYAEIENIPEVKLKTFSQEKVCELLKNRVDDKERVEKVIGNLTDEDYQLYSVPRDLEFAVEILNGGEKTLPKSRTVLYKTKFSSIFAKWKVYGNTDAEDILCKHAYEMITQRDLAFDSIDNPKFRDITTDLFEQKFLIRREKNYNFRHDLIRSYLASEYFYPRWQGLFEDIKGKPIDSNWLEMLKFSCENIDDSNEVKNLVYEVLERSIRKDLVKKLFEWLKINHPNKCESWEKDFYTKYGALDFKPNG